MPREPTKLFKSHESCAFFSASGVVTNTSYAMSPGRLPTKGSTYIMCTELDVKNSLWRVSLAVSRSDLASAFWVTEAADLSFLRLVQAGQRDRLRALLQGVLIGD